MIESLSVFCRGDVELIPVGTMVPKTKCLGFSEGIEYLIEKTVRQATLYVDDAPLSLDSSGGYWVWQPGFYAGEVAAELEYSDTSKVLRYILDVSPSSRKTGREQYLDYIYDVLDYSPRLLLGSEPATHSLGGRSQDESPWVRYARLRCFFDRYLSGLRSIVHRPCIRQKHFREQIPIHLARRIDSTSVRRLSTNPALINALVKKDQQETRPVVEDNRIDIPFSEPTFDNPANRVILQQLKQVLQLTEGLLKTFSEYKAQVSDTETDILSRLPRRIGYLRAMKKSLLKIARNEPFNKVSIVAVDAAGLNSVSGIPHYDMTHRLGLQILRKGLSSLTEDERHYLPPTWHVFESWCFVKLARGLEVRYPDFKWDLKDRVSHLFLEGVKGEARIRLYSQLNCPALMGNSWHGYYSISRNRIPDIVLEYLDCEGSSFACLDSKYMVSRPSLLDAMASAHIYRDSIKNEGKGPSLSVLLVPGNHDVPQLEEPEYLERNRVGCLPLVEATSVNRVLDVVLGAFSKKVS